MADLKMPVRRQVSYDDDFHAWTIDQEQASRRAAARSIGRTRGGREPGAVDKRTLGSDLNAVLEDLIMALPAGGRSSWSD
jgi:hypothetical protein